MSYMLKMYIASVELISPQLLNELTGVVRMGELSANAHGEQVTATCGSITFEYLKMQREAYQKVVNGLLPSIYRTLDILMSFFYELASHSDQNKMTPSNITIVMVPNLHPAAFSVPRLSVVFQTLLIDYPQIFQSE